MNVLSVFFKSRVLEWISIFIWFSGTSLFHKELSGIVVSRLLSIDGELLLGIEKVILHEFI